MTERLDRIESQLEAVNQTLATIASDFLRPALQQAVENHGAIAATDARLDRVSEVLAATSLQQDSNTQAIAQLTQKIDANERRFENLLNELRADRAESRQRFEAQQENIQNLFLELTRTNRRVGALEQAS